ncbi:COR domain-containing protein, partial [Vibrio aerogenes]
SGLGDYPQLQSLDLSYCRGLSSLSGLGDCPQLQSLDLSGCSGLSRLSCLGDCPQLQSLNLSQCAGLSSLSGLGDCPQLHSLDLIGCSGLSRLSDLTLFPQLSRLTIRHVSGEQLSWSDAKILLLERPRLDIYGALPIEHVPPELTSEFDQKAIEDWYHEIQQHGYQTPNTLKVMLLGNGRIGKTQLARRLRGEAYDDTVPSTHGIDVHDFQWQRDDMDVQINCWDFGGQDVYLGTHSLFIDQRAVYVLLWHPGFENNDLVSCEQIEMRNRPLSYWLAYLKSLAGTEANILVCQSQCDQLESEQTAPIPHPQPFQALKQLAFSAKTSDGLAVFEPYFKRALQLQSERNGEVWLPNSWFAVEAEIQALQQKQVKQLSYTAFVTLCATHQVAAPETLAGYLHQSGRVFYRRGHFDDQLILDQAWALQGVYLLLERQNVLPVLKESGGCFTRETLKNLLWDQEIEEADQQLFVEMMTQCGACFKIDEQHYLAPDALLEKSPVRFEQIWQQAASDFHVRFEYRFLHDATMRYLLSQIGDKAGAQAYYWRYGCCFYDSQHRVKVQFECALDEHWLQDEVDPFTQPGHIDIQIAGASGQALAEHLIESIMEKTHLGQKPTVHWLKGSDNQKEDAMTQQDSQEKSFSAIGTAGVAPDALPNVYFSYAWGDETDERQAVCDEIYQQLSEHDDLNVLRDRNVMKAGDSIEAFERQIGRGDFIVLLVSEKSLRSIDCMHELAMIYHCSLRQRDDFVQRVIPVVLSDAKIGGIEDCLEVAALWAEKKKKLKKMVSQVGSENAGTQSVKVQQKLTEITGCCVDALSWISDLITERQPDLQAQATVEFVLKRIRGRQTADRTSS